MVGAAPRRHERALFGILFVPSGRGRRGARRKLLKSSSGVADTTLWARVPLSLFFFWCAVFPSVDDKPRMLDIMAGTEQKNSYVLLMCKVGFPGYSAPCGIMAGMDQEDTSAVGWFLSTVPRIWQCLVRCSPWFDSGYMLRQFTAASVGGLLKMFRFQHNAWFHSGSGR